MVAGWRWERAGVKENSKAFGPSNQNKNNLKSYHSIKKRTEPGLVGHACNLSIQEVKTGRFFFYSYVHTMLGSFLPPPPTPSLPTHPPSLPPTPSKPDRNYFALISNFVVERV
jgi:hypothetical protein